MNLLLFGGVHIDNKELKSVSAEITPSEIF